MSAKQICAIAAVCGVASASSAVPPKAHELTADYTFSQYKAHFGKAYDSAEEEASREAIFRQNLAKILKHNTNPKKSYTMGLNQFTDVKSSSEVPMGNTLRNNFNLIKELRKQPHVSRHVSNTTDPNKLPKKVDWRQTFPSVVAPVRNQGRCGDCWAHATVETAESHWAIKNGMLWTLSQQQVSECTKDPRACGGTGGCQGATYELGWEMMKLASDNGVTNTIASEWVYPFTSWGGKWSPDNCHDVPKAEGTTVKVTGYKHVGDLSGVDTATTLEMMDAVANVGPLGLSVAAVPWIHNHYESGVFDDCTYPIEIDHAVVLDGYGTDEETGMDYWLVRNSWSPAWGEDGYIRIKREMKPECGTVMDNTEGIGCTGGPANISSCGMCGILLDPAYPTTA